MTSPEDQATRLVRDFLDAAESGHSTVYEGVDGRLAVSDVEADTAEFVSDLRVIEENGLLVPATSASDGPPVPMALRLAVKKEIYDDPPNYRDSLPGALDEWVNSDRENELIPTYEARLSFLTRAADFLVTRITAVRAWESGDSSQWLGISFLQRQTTSGGPLTSTPGALFEVDTNSSNLTVYWSGAYRTSSNYFGAPTSPARNVLQAGTYKFGVDGGQYKKIKWANNAIVQLPGTPKIHLNY